MMSKTSVPLPPKLCKANPNRTEINSTCSISPLANASTIVVGMMCMMNSVVVSILPGPVYCAIALASSVAGSIFMPAPGLTTLTMISPTINAIVLTISK